MGHAGAGAVRAWDSADAAGTRRVAGELSSLGVEVRLGGDGTALLEAEPRPACVVKSPGIGWDAPLLARAADHGVAVIDELELGWRLDDRPVVAITGTNGKSTVAELVRAVLERAGRRPRVAGNTAFGPPLSGLAHDEADVVVAEVSSYQLEACPAFLPDAAVLTNVTEDHFERHTTMEAYAAAKRRVALRDDAQVPVAVVGVDDPFGRELACDLERAGARVTSVGRHPRADYRLGSASWADKTASVEALVHGAPLRLAARLPGEHNGLNLLAALALADALAIGRATSLPALAEAGAPPGRLEAVDEGQPFDVLVDFAHNPAGIAETLATARGLAAGRPHAAIRVVACALSVLTTEQRRAMGRAVAAGADDLVLSVDRVSADEPRDELPAGLLEGAREGGVPEVVPERAEAVARVLGRARPGDVVLVLGRGARTYAVDDKGEPTAVDDRDLVRRALRAAGG